MAAGVSGPWQNEYMFIVLGGSPTGRVTLTELDLTGQTVAVVSLARDELGPEVARREPERPRWVWEDTSTWYPVLLAAGVSVERCHDLDLVRGILRFAESAPPTPYIETLRAEAPDVEADLAPRQLPPLRQRRAGGPQRR